jgi:hypothetical protein
MISMVSMVFMVYIRFVRFLWFLYAVPVVSIMRLRFSCDARYSPDIDLHSDSVRSTAWARNTNMGGRNPRAIR